MVHNDRGFFPLVSYIIAQNSVTWFGGYVFSYEVIILNAAITILGMLLASKPRAMEVCGDN